MCKVYHIQKTRDVFVWHFPDPFTYFVLFCIFLSSQEQKLKFYRLMIEVDQHDGAYLDICRHYRAIYDTPIIKDDPSKWKEVRNHSSQHLPLLTVNSFMT